MKPILTILTGVSILLFCSNLSYSQASCLSPGTLSNGCAVAGDLHNAAAGQTGSCTSTTSGTAYGVWYKFTATATTASVTLTGPESDLGLTTTYLEAFNYGTCGSLTPIACQNISSALNLTGLFVGSEYYIRVYVIVNPNTNPGNRRGFTITLQQTPANNTCTSPVSLTPSTTCVNVAGTLSSATASSPVVTSSCTGTPGADVWYSFVAPTAYPTITLSSIGSNFSSNYIQILSGSCGSFTSVACTNATSITPGTALTPGNTYFIRVYTLTAAPSGCNWDFSICVTYTLPPANDECSGATNLSVGSTNSTGSVWDATASSGIPLGCASGTPDDDVWYKFTATSINANIALSSLGSNLSTAGAYVQLFSGACTSLTSLACGYTTLSASGLSIGIVYYLRVYSYTSGSIGGTSSGSTFSITVSVPTAVTTTNNIGGSRMNEVFLQTTLSPANVLLDPWEIAYGPDGYLWITEAKGYKVYRMNPTTGLKNTVLDVSQNSAFLPVADRSFNAQFATGTSPMSPWPQGGFAGLVLHPKFMDASTPKNYVYVSYVHTYVTTITSPTNGGVIFTNRIVRFTYNTTTGLLESPVSLCDTLPGSNDHNSQRMIIAPVGATNYLFYASGDMGAGQFSNTARTIKSQIDSSYEGKILRFNLEDDGDAGTLDKWIPNDNPFNATNQTAVWSTGMRNNQGFASANINGVDYLYGTSHGPFSDDELNIIERGKNYGHPLVIGYSADGNYNNSKAGAVTGTLPLITSESANATAIGSSYKDPIFSFYPASQATVNGIYLNNGSNSAWPSEAPSGLDIYTHSLIPGWKNSLVNAALKWGRLIRLKLNTTGTPGTSIIPTNGQDTVTYFESSNRYRDIAFAPGGKDMFVIMDKSSATSGPSTDNPSIVSCPGCVQKYTFLGYSHNSSTNRSTIPSFIDITSGTANTLTSGTTVTIDATNNNLWVPITGPDGNIMAEIKANGNNLGEITSSFYNHSGAVREDASKRLYLNRSITITPQNQPSSAVNVRFYFTAAELTALMGASNSDGVPSGVSSINNIKVMKNNDATPVALTNATATLMPAYSVTHAGNTNGGYVIQADISSFSSFYFGDPSSTPLPLELLTFEGQLQNDATVLKWETGNEQNTSHFSIERSKDAKSFEKIGTVEASGNSSQPLKYSFTDYGVSKQASPMVYYRLKMIDKDGTFVKSKTISVALDPISSFVLLYPNPITDVLNIRVSLAKSDNVHIRVTDMQGRIMYSSKKEMTQGVSDMSLDVKSWPAQTYLVQVSGSDNKVISTSKVVKTE